MRRVVVSPNYGLLETQPAEERLCLLHLPKSPLESGYYFILDAPCIAAKKIYIASDINVQVRELSEPGHESAGVLEGRPASAWIMRALQFGSRQAAVEHIHSGMRNLGARGRLFRRIQFAPRWHRR